MGPLSHDAFAWDFHSHRAYTPPQIDDAVPATLPGIVENQRVHTPLTYEPACANMNTVVGGALAPIPASPPTRRPSKAGPDLRL